MFQNLTHHKNILQGGKYGCPLIFSNKKASTGLQVSTEDVKVYFRKSLAFAKTISVLVNLKVINIIGKNYQKKRRTYAYENA